MVRLKQILTSQSFKHPLLPIRINRNNQSIQLSNILIKFNKLEEMKFLLSMCD